MKPPRPVTWLHLALAFVIGQASLLLLLRARGSGLHGGLHPAIATTLAAVELLAVCLFLIPKTLVLGARLLWVVLVVATLLHLHAGEAPSPIFLVYAAGIGVVAADAARPRHAEP
jgi:hypothetical protein